MEDCLSFSFFVLFSVLDSFESFVDFCAKNISEEPGESIEKFKCNIGYNVRTTMHSQIRLYIVPTAYF